MIKYFGRVFFFCVLIIALQVLVLNQIHLLRMAMPFVYIYFLMKLPVGTKPMSILAISFFTGIAIDCFLNTQGMHAAACTLMGFVHPRVCSITTEKALPEEAYYSYFTCGYRSFISYVLILTTVHHTALFLIEAMTLFNFWFFLWRLVLNILVTGFLICVIELLSIQVIQVEKH